VGRVARVRVAVGGEGGARVPLSFRPRPSLSASSPASPANPRHAATARPVVMRSTLAPLGWGLAPYGAYPVAAAASGGGLGEILTLGVFAFIAWTAFQAFRGSSASGDASFDDPPGAVSVARLQVGLLATGGRRLQTDLDRLAARADTTTPAGLHFVLQEALLALLRNPEFAVYGAAKSQVGRTLDGAERKFTALSMRERGKVREETVVNFGGAKKTGVAQNPAPRSGEQEFVVVTILLAARGAIRVPAVRGGDELATALGALGGVPASDVLAVEVLWTPSDPADSYTRADLTADFPELNNL